MKNWLNRTAQFAPAGIALGVAVTLLGLNFGAYPAIAGGLLGTALAAVLATRPN